MTTTRRIFTDEFKQEAVALLASSGRSLAQIARELGVQASVLRKWQRRLTGSGGTSMPPIQQATAPPDHWRRSSIGNHPFETRTRPHPDGTGYIKKTVAIFSEAPR